MYTNLVFLQIHKQTINNQQTDEIKIPSKFSVQIIDFLTQANTLAGRERG